MDDPDNLIEYYTHHPVMVDYIRLGYVRTKDEAGKLHMFFSPCNLPKGLTREQIRTCIRAYSIREKQKDTYAQKHNAHIMLSDMRLIFITQATLQVPTTVPPVLPGELLQSPMTAQSFQMGMGKFIETALKR